MSNDDLLIKPHRIGQREDAWWYETKGGFEVVVECRRHDGSKIIEIPWRSVRAALARKDKAKETP